MKGYQVEVRQFGDLVVAIEERMLAGREITKQDEEGIRECARQLLAFIGDSPHNAEASMRHEALESPRTIPASMSKVELATPDHARNGLKVFVF